MPDSNMVDGSLADGTLRIEWATTPVIVGTTAAGHRLDEVQFRMENLKAAVDVDPNDPNTTRAEVKLFWDADDAPEALVFPNAPAGRYTQILLKLDEGDSEDSYEFEGVSNQGGSFKLEDTATIPISMPCNFVLAAGETKTVTIHIDLQVVDTIDIEALESGNGVDHYLDADDDSAVAMQLRTALQTAFSVEAQ